MTDSSRLSRTGAESDRKVTRRPWTPAENAILREHWRQMSAEELARKKLTGRTKAAIMVRASLLGLKKQGLEPDWEQLVKAHGHHIEAVTAVPVLLDLSGLSSADIARRTGLTQEIVARIRRGYKKATLEQTLKLCHGLGFKLVLHRDRGQA